MTDIDIETAKGLAETCLAVYDGYGMEELEVSERRIVTLSRGVLALLEERKSMTGEIGGLYDQVADLANHECECDHPPAGDLNDALTRADMDWREQRMLIAEAAGAHRCPQHASAQLVEVAGKVKTTLDGIGTYWSDKWTEDESHEVYGMLVDLFAAHDHTAAHHAKEQAEKEALMDEHRAIGDIWGKSPHSNGSTHVDPYSPLGKAFMVAESTLAGKCTTCHGTGLVRHLGMDNDEIVEDCPDPSHNAQYTTSGTGDDDE